MQGLRVEHLNTLIKFYASELAKRIEELDKRIPYNQIVLSSSLDEDITAIKDKYQSYFLGEGKEVECAAKMNQRIIQIFSFFKWKSKNQFLLNLIQQNIQAKLNDLLEKKSLGELISFVIDSVAPGSLIKQKEEKMRTKSRFYGKDFHPETSKSNTSNMISKRKTASVLSSKKVESIPKDEKPFCKIEKKLEELNKIYYGLNLDRHHLIKSIDNIESTKKEMMKRNESAMMKFKRPSNKKMRMKTEADVSIGNPRQVFKEVRNEFQWANKKTPTMSFSCWSRKKKRIKTSKKTKVQDQNVLMFC